MNKISLGELKKMFGDYQSGRYKPLVATKPGFAHVHNPHYLPPKSNTTPKVWEEQQKTIKMNIEAKKKHKPLLYQCSDCLVPMEKLGYCYTHKKWASLIPVKENK
jgi:hypothetical protein